MTSYSESKMNARSISYSLVFILLCISHGFAFQGFAFETKMIEMKLTSCRFDSVGVISDEDNLEKRLLYWTKKSEKSVNFFDIRNGGSGAFQRWLRTLYVDVFVTDFVVAVNNPGQIMDDVDDIYQNESFRQMAALPHKSRWMVMVWTQGQVQQINDQQRDSPLDNVAMVYLTERAIPQIWTYVWANNRIKLPKSLNNSSSILSDSPWCALFPNTKYGLNGRKLHVLGKSTVGNTYLRIQQNPETGHLEYAGMLNNLIGDLSRAMNFTYSIWPPPSQVKNNLSWPDFDELIANGSVHFSLSHFDSLLLNRSAQIMVAGSPYKYHKITGIYKKPESFQLDMLRAMEYGDVYFILTVCLLITAGIYAISVYHVCPYHGKNCEKKKEFHGQSKSRTRGKRNSILCRQYVNQYLHALAYFAATSLNQGKLPNVHLMSSRVLVFAWGLLIVCVTSLLTSIITANSVSGLEQVPFYTFKQMVVRGDYTWSIESESEIIKYTLERSGTVTGIELSKNAKRVIRPTEEKEEPLPYSYLQSLPEKEVFISFKEDLEQWLRAQPDPNNYVIMKDFSFQAMHALGFPRGSELNLMVSNEILRLRETGVLSALFKPSSADANRTDDSNGKSMDIWKSFIHILTLALAVVLLIFATIALIIESISTKIQKYKMARVSTRGSTLDVNEQKTTP